MHTNRPPRLLTLIAATLLALIPPLAAHARNAVPGNRHPQFEQIREAVNDPASQYYYPRLLASFMSKDTVMTPDDYHYFYYGTMFQEDYNPYRTNPFQKELEATRPLYFKHGHLTRAEKNQIEKLALKSLRNNPLDLQQLMYLVYVYENNNKYNLAKIWKHKLDNLLLTIARSGTGEDLDHAWVVAYPSHEFDYFNLSGITVTGQEFVAPYYEKVTVTIPKKDETKEYYFDLHHVLEQYYLKHPTELPQ